MQIFRFYANFGTIERLNSAFGDVLAPYPSVIECAVGLCNFKREDYIMQSQCVAGDCIVQSQALPAGLHYIIPSAGYIM
mgnify:CR=1 FL=1